MKITKICLENFRSIKKIELEMNEKLNAFIGGNSVGKSNIFDAINWLLGPIYPSFNSTKKEDHFMGDESNKIKIKLNFDDGNYLELTEEWTDLRGNKKSGLNFNGNYCKDEDRQKYCSAYIGVERAITDYMPSNKWSLMGRMLQEINSLFMCQKIDGEETLKCDKLKQDLDGIRDNLLFSVKDDSGENIMKKFLKILQEESTKQINVAGCNFDIKLNLYDPWNFYKTLQLMVKEQDIGLEFSASQLGMGIQASLTIAILKAYASLKLRNQPPLFIDEPELFLHPHAQKTFYKVLSELAENGTQIFYTTHSPNFLSAGKFDEISLVRKGVNGTYVKNAVIGRFIKDLRLRENIVATIDDIKLRFLNAYENTGDSQSANEAFFAKKIILVEGSSESLLLPYFFNKLNFNYILEGISIVACGSKGELDRFLRLYSEFGIPCYVLFDGDAQNKGTKDEENSKDKNKKLLEILGATIEEFPTTSINNNYLIFEKNLEDNLGFATSKKGLNLFMTTKEKIESGEISIPSWVSELIEKVKIMPQEINSILKEQ